MLRYISFITEATQPDDEVHRIDNKPIRDFGKNLKSYDHKPDWTQSGQTNDLKRPPERGLKRSRGLFAAAAHDAAPYAAPRDVPWSQHHDSDGKSTITFDKRDEKKVRGNRPILSTFSRSKFKHLRASREHFSENPGSPNKQRVITDPVKHMQDNGHKVRFVPHLGREVERLRKAGHTVNGENIDD